MTTKPITTRLPDWIDRDIREYWQRHGEKPSPGFRRAIEEWWTMQNLPLIEFREGVSGRRASLRGGPDVWEVCMVARDCDWDLHRLDEHFGGHVPRDALEQARQYEQWFPQQIDAWLRENERIERVLRGSTA